MAPSDALTLSCVVPATDDPPTLDRCLEAIRSANHAPDEVIVVSKPAASGPAMARNRGADGASGEVLVFVDADVVVHADAFELIRAAFESEPHLTAVFGSYDDAPEAPGAVSGFRNLLHHHVHQEGGGEASTFWAGLGAIRRDAFPAVGGFDAERYSEPSIEDIELGMRLRSGRRLAAARPPRSGDPPEALDPVEDDPHRLPQPRAPLVAAAARRRHGLDRPQSWLAPPALGNRMRHRGHGGARPPSAWSRPRCSRWWP